MQGSSLYNFVCIIANFQLKIKEMTQEETPHNNNFTTYNMKSSHHDNNSPGKQIIKEDTLIDKANEAQIKEWDDARCAVCMDHPHNAVLLLCSSYEKGCRPYMCDTSYRHSNCLDQYRRHKENDTGHLSESNEVYRNSPRSTELNPRTLQNLNGNPEFGGSERSRAVSPTFRRSRQSRSQLHVQQRILGPSNTESETEDRFSVPAHANESKPALADLKCPLCRGSVHGWKVVEEARQYLNLKVRSCSRESCSFVGTYHDLRKHARTTHPTTRPADIDPSRERAWKRLERQQEYEDVLSTIHSAVPGGIVVGDYVIENEDTFPVDHMNDGDSFSTAGRFWRRYLLLRMFGSHSHSSHEDGGGFARRWRESSRQHLSSPFLAQRRRTWTEAFLSSEESEDASTNAAARRRRRRLNRERLQGDI
eukprot:TRINITY_DN1162_c0_g1_i1.p1 TRINITY_DN1162_c0_g1~~TRINITY_DN1162_c0_g1_i1.p1  ORF type:complete len:421 (-),score=80.74 TRINITY_DN1162_c0_g1_i1:313-1575(-)